MGVCDSASTWGKPASASRRATATGLLATPVATLQRVDADERAFRLLVAEYGPVEIVVGLPLSLNGGDTASTTDAREFAADVARWTALPVRLVDERLSTVSAQRALRDSGRRTKGSRPVIDQVAAVIILQNALDTERSAGRPPGVLVDPESGVEISGNPDR